MNCPDVLPAVVILTWNDGHLLDAAVASVPSSEASEVIVVDNGSDPPAQVRSGVRLLRLPSNSGVAGGRNAGVSATSAEIVCFLDSDAELREGALRRLTKEVLAGPDIAMAVPAFEGQRPEDSAGRTPTILRKMARGLGATSTYGRMRRDESTAWDVEFGIGACQVFRRSAFDEVGALDESIFYGPEDVDFCLRLRRAGYRIRQVGDAPVFHPPRRRNRNFLTRRGLAHAVAVLRQLQRQQRAR